MSTRKHFKAAADAVRLISNLADRRKSAEILASQFARENARFDRARFFAACGL